MKLSIPILSFIFCLSAFSNKEGSFELQRRLKLLDLIHQEMQTINSARKKSARLQYRLFELMSEKIKIFKEEENAKFIILKKKDRKVAFKKTLQMYKETQTYGLKILKRIGDKSLKAAIYYTLGLNSRDYSYDKHELRYFLKSIEYSKSRHNINYLAKVSLAEYYYNDKKYPKAVKIYEQIISNKNDEWYTKNLYNYGWCLLKTKKFLKSIEMLEESYLLSATSGYINMKDQAMSGLINFYIYGKDIGRGISFIETHSKQKTRDLLSLAKKAAKKGYASETYSLIKNLDSKITQDKKSEHLNELKLFEFDFYKQEHDRENLLRIAKLLPTLKLDSSENEDAVLKVSDFVGVQQIILKKDFSKENRSYNPTLLSEIITLFNILSKLDPKEATTYSYYIAETYYSVQEEIKALEQYKITLNLFDQFKPKEDLREKSIDAIFSLIETITFSEKNKDRELKFAFHRYLNYWPKTAKAQKIYPRLYSLYLKDNLFEPAQNVLSHYIDHFQGDNKAQQELYKVQLDLIIALKRTDLLAKKIQSMRSGFLSFEFKEIDKSEKILANILFEGFKKMSQAGNFSEAIKGHTKVFLTSNYPKSIKAEAAFNVGINYTNIGNNQEAFKWYTKSFDFYTKKEQVERRAILEKMSLRTSLLQDYIHSSKIDLFLLRRFCFQKDKNEITFRRVIQSFMARNYMRKLEHTFEQYSKCLDQIPTDLYDQVVTHLYETHDHDRMISFIKTYSLNEKLKDKISFYYENIYWKNYIDQSNQDRGYLKLLESTSPDRAKTIASVFKNFYQFKKEAKLFKDSSIKINIEMMPEDFSKKLSTRMEELPKLIKKSNEILNEGDKEFSLLTYYELITLITQFRDEIKEYKFPIKDKNFQKQFQSQMNSLALNIENERVQYLQVARDMINKYEVISTRVDLFYEHINKDKDINLRTPASAFATTIDFPRSQTGVR